MTEAWNKMIFTLVAAFGLALSDDRRGAIKQLAKARREIDNIVAELKTKPKRFRMPLPPRGFK